MEWLEDFNLQAAAGFPGQALGPINAAVDLGKGIPAAAIGEKIPTKTRLGLGNDGILKTKHISSDLKSSPNMRKGTARRNEE
jgi:hypothetical protein